MDAIERVGIHWQSLLLYAVNFGVLFVVLTKLLYKPILRMLDERRETIRRSLEEAKELKEKFKKEVAEREREQAILLDEMKLQVHASKAQAEAQSKLLMETTERERERLLRETREEVSRLKASIVQDAEQEIVQRIEQTVLAVLREKSSTKETKKDIEQAWKHVSSAVQKN